MKNSIRGENRPLGKLPYLLLDARYEKVRHGGSVVDCAVLVAVGVLPNGKRTVLGVSVSLSEAEVHWRQVPGQARRTGPLRRGDDHQRRPRRTPGRTAGRLSRCALATVPVPSAAERRRICPQSGNADHRGRRLAWRVQRP